MNSPLAWGHGKKDPSGRVGDPGLQRLVLDVLGAARRFRRSRSRVAARVRGSAVPGVIADGGGRQLRERQALRPARAAPVDRRRLRGGVCHCRRHRAGARQRPVAVAALVVLLGIVGAPAFSLAQVVVADLVAGDEERERADATVRLAGNVGVLAGPPVAALVIATAGWTALLLASIAGIGMVGGAPSPGGCSPSRARPRSPAGARARHAALRETGRSSCCCSRRCSASRSTAGSRPCCR